MLGINIPKPTHPDMVLVRSQGDPATVPDDLAKARQAAEAIRAERVAARDPIPTARFRFRSFGAVSEVRKATPHNRVEWPLLFIPGRLRWTPPLLG